ncbi:MAG TPA: ATP-binding cassette domain-containing protein, partial [Acidimicrobiia bacterium]
MAGSAPLLQVKGLEAGAGEVEILRGLDLEMDRGQVHAIMGPNGSGKSTFANVLMGHPQYKVTGGSILVDGEEILGLPTYQRAQRGMFLAFQYPEEIPGVSVVQFLRQA